MPENDTYKYVELKGDVRFDNVVFGYTPEKRYLIKYRFMQSLGRRLLLSARQVQERLRLSILLTDFMKYHQEQFIMTE